MRRVKDFCFVLFLFIAVQVYGQLQDFNGIWVLRDMVTISGAGYLNGVPKQLIVSKVNDSITIKRVYHRGNSDDYFISESLSLNRKPSVVIRSKSRRQSLLKFDSIANTFSLEVTYKDINTGEQTSADFIENWRLSIPGKELVIEKIAKEPDGTNWSMKGVYEQKLKEALESEKAKGNGIRFIDDLSWEQVKAIAKKENKFIFVDCFATWCMPCKKMELDVFTLNIIGKEVNDKFVSVRVQMDSTNKDEERVKNRYKTAHEFWKAYNISGFPTFLFFDSIGNIVHKDLGTLNANEFLELLRNARNPDRQYYTLIKSYRKNEISPANLDYLVFAAKSLGEIELAEEVLMEYKNNYLVRLSLDSLLSERYLRIANEFQHFLIIKDGSKGVFFKLFYQKSEIVDRMLNQKGFASFHVNGIITKEEIEDKIYNKGKPVADPQWDKIKSDIEKKYQIVDAEKLVLDAQIKYYQSKKDWSSQIKYIVKKADKYGPLSLGMPDGSGSDNTIANALLAHCDDKLILTKAISWMESIINSSAYKYPIPMVYGNYGGILYKGGRRKEGIACFEKHLNAIGYKSPADLDKDPRFKAKVEILEKMKKGKNIDSTWNIGRFN